MMEIKVIVFEDNENLRTGLFQLIDDTPGYRCVGAFENCNNLLRNIRDTKPDIVLMDIGMPGINGIEAVRIICQHYPGMKILMQTIFEENEKIFQSILAGASGYILKNTSPARILEAIKEIREGGAPMSPSVAIKVLKMVGHKPSGVKNNAFNLSDRETEVLNCLVEGMSYKLIAETCFISVDTVRGHIRSIYEKLHVHSKSEAVAKAIKGNIV
jgi:DNA-binding NarL/FixJ family response regulator